MIPLMPAASSDQSAMLTPQVMVQQARQWRHLLHQQPELSMQEVATTAFIRDQLQAMGLTWQACTDTGTVTTIAPTASGPHIALRADIDALPITEQPDHAYKSQVAGCMHACGHDGHTAALLATCYWLQVHASSLPGPVTMIFQPGEEGAHGMRRMLHAGLLAMLPRPIDQAYGFHSWPAIDRGQFACPDGAVMSANAEFQLTLRGEGGHASQPEACDDVVLALSQWVCQAHTVVSRRLPPQQAAVCSVAVVRAGEGKNVLPGEAQALGSIRGASGAVCDEIGHHLQQMAQCQGGQIVAEWDYHRVYPAVINDPDCAARVRNILQQYGDVQPWPGFVPLMASEDFSYLAAEVPAAFVLMGAGAEGHRQPCHHPAFDFNDDLLPTWIGTQVRLAGGPWPETLDDNT